MSRGRVAVVAALLGALLAVGIAPTEADPLGPPIKVEIPPLVPGLLDPPDPPTVAQPDPDLLALDVPREHPWMLFDAAELPALRARILGADPDSVVGAAWQRLLDGVQDPDFAGRDTVAEGLQDFPDQRWGRDDLVSVALVWHITGDDRYLDQARGLLQYAVGAGPNYGAPIEPGVDEFYIQRAHRLNGFALAYDLLYPGFTAAERTQLRTIVQTLGAQHLAHSTTAWWGTISTGSNITGNNAAAIGTAGLALWHDDPTAPTWVLRAEQLTRSYFHDGFDPEGAGFEGILYGNYGLRIPTYLEHALQRAGHDRSLFDVGGLPSHQQWFAYELLPGGGAVNPLNDARYYEINPTYTTWAIAHGDTPELSAWLFDEFVRKVPSTGRNVGELVPTLLWYRPSDPAFDPADHLRLAEDYATRGLVHVRSDWEPGALMASFEARQNDWGEGVHQNQDVNNFTLYSDGAKLAVDSRYGNWLSKLTAGDFEAMRTSESEAHNTVVIDGRTQDFHGKGELRAFATTAPEPGDPEPANREPGVLDAGGVDVALGDARLAYLTRQPDRQERVFLHVRATADTPDYVVVADRVRQDGAVHDHAWYLHSDWRNTMTVRPDGTVRIDSGEVAGVGMDVSTVTLQPSRTSVGTFTTDDAQDWARLGEDGRKAQPRLAVRSTGRRFEAITVLAPTGPGETAPTVRRIPADGGLAVQVEVAPGIVDTLLLRVGDGSVIAGGVRVDGLFAMVRTTGTGSSRTAGVHALVEGTRLAVGGHPVVASRRPATVAGR